MAKNSFDFMFDSRWYTLQGAESMLRGTADDFALMKSEYTRMRDVAVKRIKRLGAQFPKSKAYQRWLDPTGQLVMPARLRDLPKERIPEAFAELAKFVRSRGSSVSGQKAIKQKTIRTWQDQGLNLNEQNYDRAIDILEELRKRKLVYGSDKVVELADSMVNLDEDQTNELLDHLQSVMDNLDRVTTELERMDSDPETEGMSFDEIIDMLE